MWRARAPPLWWVSSPRFCPVSWDSSSLPPQGGSSRSQGCYDSHLDRDGDGVACE
ncbi:excalibur calcium-binding domain-containing protein [Streptomyces prunicolor]|uniref:excalibur calcium-binding domain-containing protein n=1 Tax=Streptomyces prunicolor TaxID=67348 RepID=UPI0037D71FFB